MRVMKYSTRLDCDRKPYLVKEAAINYKPGTRFRFCPQMLADVVNGVFDAQNQTEEHLYLVCCTGDSLRGVFEVSKGSTDLAIVDIPTIFRNVFLLGANSFALLHNHPGGGFTPSEEDLKTTKRVIESSKLLGVKFVDHIILGTHGAFESLADARYGLF